MIINQSYLLSSDGVFFRLSKNLLQDNEEDKLGRNKGIKNVLIINRSDLIKSTKSESSL